ncbi:head decoration protein [Cupriavidus metallidurans]|uniref:Head decoration protein n=1 Tax=Cupriavidus metallidurans TaxID=119219 RepID=A0A482IPI4_9BURK|nr:head decoration protein [Cupriavidus metallidurans]QBP09846.1 head decoration protein [Cupriavidus metallidurans]
MKTQTYTQPKFVSDVVHTKVNPAWSVDTAVLSGGAFQIGTVGARVNGKVVPLDASTDAGVGAAAVVVIADADATAGDVMGPVVARGAVVLADGLVWPAGITTARKAMAIAALEARGIVTRTGLATATA